MRPDGPHPNTIATHRSKSSSTPSSGVHSNMMTPGYPSAVIGGLDATGIENTVSVSHCPPEPGTSNLHSSQMAVASLSGLRDSHIRQKLDDGDFDDLDLRTERTIWRKEPCAQRRACSSLFFKNKKND